MSTLTQLFVSYNIHFYPILYEKDKKKLMLSKENLVFLNNQDRKKMKISLSEEE